MSSERFTVSRSEEQEPLGTDRSYGATQYFDDTRQDDAFYGKVNVAKT